MKNYFDLTGKVALVTGASSGLGVQFAKALANQGADLAIVARRVEKLEATKAAIEKEYGVKVYIHKCDVTKEEEIKQTVDDVINEYGKIDILVNNAGLGLMGPAASQSNEDWEKMMATNINGVYYFARDVGKYMIERRYGKIINIGSIHSNVAMKPFTLSAYCTTKGGVQMLTKALATEWAKYNITVNAIGPAYFESEMTKDAISLKAFNEWVKSYCPMERIGKEGELDGALIYFASDASSYTTGQLLSVDGGWTAI